MDNKEIKKKLNRLWKLGRKDLDRMLKETSDLIKKGESHIKEASKNAEQNLEAMILSLKREKLYYELGKSAAGVSQNKWTKNKKLSGLLNKTKNISRDIKKLKKK